MLTPHQDTERSLSYSGFVTGKVDYGTGKPGDMDNVVTATLLHVKGKVIFLYARAERADLEWSRTASKIWADQILEQNPSTGDIATQEAKSRSGLSWGKILAIALVGAFIFVVIRLSRKKSPSPV